jgi:hypothetical protein
MRWNLHSAFVSGQGRVDLMKITADLPSQWAEGNGIISISNSGGAYIFRHCGFSLLHFFFTLLIPHFLMGATDSKLAFRKGVFRLFEERVSTRPSLTQVSPHEFSLLPNCHLDHLLSTSLPQLMTIGLV